MTPHSISLLTICGLEELDHHRARAVTHVLSILDPDWPDPEAFRAYDQHHRTILRFHDVIEPRPNLVLPRRDHVEAILAFGRELRPPMPDGAAGHLLIHCHAGISRSTAAMAMLLAQLDPQADEDSILGRVVEIRPQAWPNSVMIGFADEALGRGGRLSAAVARLYARQLAAQPKLAALMRSLDREREVALAERSIGAAGP